MNAAPVAVIAIPLERYERLERALFAALASIEKLTEAKKEPLPDKLTIEQAAKHTGYSTVTLRRMIDSGSLKCIQRVKRGKILIDSSEIERISNKNQKGKE
jgi:excisionase family DNA binding protein